MLFDITRTLNSNLAVWPGDDSFSAKVMADMNRGDVVNLTTLTLSSHTGTHVDAPCHFINHDLFIDQISLDVYIGPATVVTVQREAGPLIPADFPNVDWSNVQRLLVHSSASHKPIDQFQEQFVYPSPELADWLGQHQVVLFGSDAPSMDKFNSPDLVGHKAMRHNGIALVENLIFNNIPDGEYELIALPLKIEKGDGSPVRAILRA